jgi:hypothetical protein
VAARPEDPAAVSDGKFLRQSVKRPVVAGSFREVGASDQFIAIDDPVDAAVRAIVAVVPIVVALVLSYQSMTNTEPSWS